ncbi:transport and Golgi organization protein 1 homolog isoform X2 [Pungitius pungitius]|uniref:transport and Golgi organization protein 1 homolog isoform X2 n=1 Tax=Pungitius pungitius TaxID=134920 RepID=UPI002E13BF9D
MAAKHFYRQGLLLLLFNFISTAALEKRFSDFKRCADQECSMLLCRGKAIRDFSGPDCRFLKVKKSETIYVYYKLSGRRADIWAGSVGSSFGYFPNNLLAVNHLYTDKEIEVPSEETDFVCFDTGFDKFDNYDIDLLLGSTVEENDGENNSTSEQSQSAEGEPEETEQEETEQEVTEQEETEQEETEPSADEATDSEKQTEHHDHSEYLDKVSEDHSASFRELEVATESPSTEEVQPEAAAAPGATERAEGENAGVFIPENGSERSETKDATTNSQVESVPEGDFPLEKEPVTVSEGVQIPQLKTTLGTTFDAVITEEKITKNVTPYEEEEEEEEGENVEKEEIVIAETPLLSFSEETKNTPAPPPTNAPAPPPTNAPAPPPTNAPAPPSTNAPAPPPTNAPAPPPTNAPAPPSTNAPAPPSTITPAPPPTNAPALPPTNAPAPPSTNAPAPPSTNAPAPPPTNNPELPSTTQDDKLEAAEEKNVWTSIGDAVFSVVTGGERTEKESSSEEEDEDEVEEAASTTPPSFEEENKALEEEQVPIESSEKPDKIEPLLFVHNNESDVGVIGHEDNGEETLKPTDGPISHHVEATAISVAPVSQEAQDPDIKTDEEKEVEEEMEEVSTESAGKDDDGSSVATEQRKDLDNKFGEIQTETNIEIAVTEAEEERLTEDSKSEDLVVEDDAKTLDDHLPNLMHDHLVTDSESNNNGQPESSVEGPEILKEHIMDEGKGEEEEEEQMEIQKEEEMEIQKEEEKEDLLEDENALSLSQSDHKDPEASPETAPPPVTTPEPEYSDSVMRLTLLRDHFTEESMEKLQNVLGLRNLFKVEAMFSDLDTEFQASRRSHTGDVEGALQAILEASETPIMDEIEKMLDGRSSINNFDQRAERSGPDVETELMDGFQEFAFSLREKYSTASDSVPLAEKPSETDHDEPKLQVEEEEVETPHTVEEDVLDSVPEAKRDDNATVADRGEMPAETKEDQVVLDEAHTGPDVSAEEDGGEHFNENIDDQPSFSASDELPEVPQATPDNPSDVGHGVEVEPSPPDSLDSMGPVSEIDEDEIGLFSTAMVYMGCIISTIKSKMAEWTIEVVSLLPEEWKPGETLFGCPWKAVLITALIGVVTFTLFLWRTVLAVKKREYLVDEKRLAEQIVVLKKEKIDALAKMSELQKQTEQMKENQKQSKETVSCTKKRMQDLESKVLEAKTLNEHIAEEKNNYAKLLKDERARSLHNGTRIEKLEKSNEKLQLSRKKIQEALAKTTVLLDEAKIREDARKVQHKSLEKDYSALKEENNTLKAATKSWEDKHKELSEQIKVFQKSQKELEDSVVLKDHNVEVLSELLSDLDACDLQKSDGKVLANGEVAPDKRSAIKNRIKQMMDVSRVQTTLTVVEEERDRFMTKLLTEEKTRKSLEEQHEELEHAIAALKSDKSHVENQLKILQQKNEIMVEMYQQKENALQQRLTKEELERRSKESQLSEVGGKAVEAEEQVKVLRQRINEMEGQMKKTEEVYKEQIKEQENKTHSNWVNARNAERALNQEKLEASKLREKLAVLTSQLNERRAPLFRPNSGQPAGPRQGDSYGPSPVSGGAPSPPIMIEGPRRPPSAPVGRRIDPYGQRPPSDPHGRYLESKHLSGMDMMGPRSSSPANMDASGPGSFLASPIRDSPGAMGQGPPLGPGPHEPFLPPGPHSRLPPPGPYRHPRPGLYPLPPNVPPNGHPGMPGPMGGEFGPRPANGHAFHPRPAPTHVLDPRGPPLPHFRPPMPHHFGPMPLQHGVRGPMGTRPPVPHDMRYPGTRDHNSPPMNLPPGVAPHGHGPPDSLHNSHSGPRQDPPQDPPMVKP